jgi:hypothetical protein
MVCSCHDSRVAAVGPDKRPSPERTATDLRRKQLLAIVITARLGLPLSRLRSRLRCNPHDMGLPLKKPHDLLVFHRITIDDLVQWSARGADNTGHTSHGVRD